jgi:hypothetical protein
MRGRRFADRLTRDLSKIHLAGLICGRFNFSAIQANPFISAFVGHLCGSSWLIDVALLQHKNAFVVHD